MATRALPQTDFHATGSIQRPEAVYRRIALSFLVALVALALVLGQVASASVVRDHHAERSVEMPADPEEMAASCDPGLLCSSYLAPAHLASGMALAFAMIRISCRERPGLCFGGPAVDLPPPRNFA